MRLLGIVRIWMESLRPSLSYTREVESLKKEAFSLERFPIGGAFSISSVLSCAWTGLDWTGQRGFNGEGKKTIGCYTIPSAHKRFFSLS